jgi:hypothetical protein
MSLREVIFPDRTRILIPEQGAVIDADLKSRVPGWALVQRHDTRGYAWVPERAVALTQGEIRRRNNDRALARHRAGNH